MVWGFFDYFRARNKPYTYTALPNKWVKTKQGTHRAVSPPKLVISVTVATVTRLRLGCTRNWLKRSSLSRFISPGHRRCSEEEQGDFKARHRSYSPLYNRVSISQEQSRSATGGRFQTCKATPGRLGLLMLFGKRGPRYTGALPSSRGVQPKTKPWALCLEKQTPGTSPRLTLLTFQSSAQQLPHKLHCHIIPRKEAKSELGRWHKNRGSTGKHLLVLARSNGSSRASVLRAPEAHSTKQVSKKRPKTSPRRHVPTAD